MSVPANLPQLIESERLLVRAVDPRHAEQMQDAIAESFDELRPWMIWAQQLGTLEERRAELAAAAERYAKGEDLRLLLFRRTDELLVGCSGFHNINWKVPRLEIGYWVRTSCRGHGYITEAVRTIADFAFRKFAAERIEIWASGANAASHRVAERAGFPLEATLRRHQRIPAGAITDSLVFARTRSLGP